MALEFLEKKLFLKKNTFTSNKHFVLAWVVEVISFSFLRISHKQAFSVLGASLSDVNFLTCDSQPQILRKDKLGFFPVHISYGVFSTTLVGVLFSKNAVFQWRNPRRMLEGQFDSS